MDMYVRTGGMLLYVDRSIKFAIVALNICERNWWTITIKISNERVGMKKIEERYLRWILGVDYGTP